MGKCISNIIKYKKYNWQAFLCILYYFIHTIIIAHAQLNCNPHCDWPLLFMFLNNTNIKTSMFMLNIVSVVPQNTRTRSIICEVAPTQTTQGAHVHVKMLWMELQTLPLWSITTKYQGKNQIIPIRFVLVLELLIMKEEEHTQT